MVTCLCLQTQRWVLKTTDLNQKLNKTHIKRYKCVLLVNYQKEAIYLKQKYSKCVHRCGQKHGTYLVYKKKCEFCISRTVHVYLDK